MECAKCGFRMEPFETECPRCLRTGEHVIPSQAPGAGAAMVKTPPPAAVMSRAHIERVKNINALRFLSNALIWAGLIGAGTLIMWGLWLLTDEELRLTSFYVFFGALVLAGIAWGWSVLVNWCAELLQAVGKIEEHLIATGSTHTD